MEGHDAAAKAAIMAGIVFGAEVTAADVHCEGISTLSAGDITFARRLGHVIKLLAIAERVDADAQNGGGGAGGPGCGDSSPASEEQSGTPAAAPGPSPAIAVRVHPAMVPEDHPLASVRDSFNAVFVEGDAAGELMLYGRGAGGRPTASAVLGDLIDAAAEPPPGRRCRATSHRARPHPSHR